MIFAPKKGDGLRRWILEALVRYNGNIARTAHEVGYERRAFYLTCSRLKLWPAINKIRRESMREKNEL
jgi:hypothetical protein